MSERSGPTVPSMCIPNLALLGRGWRSELQSLLNSANTSLLIASPYITEVGTRLVIDSVRPGIHEKCNLLILTDLSPIHICEGAIDPFALRNLLRRFLAVKIFHLPRMHAKVYVADLSLAIVSSGNLTSGGLTRNFEYGVQIRASTLVRTIRRDLTNYSSLGALIDSDRLDAYCQTAREVREAYRAQQRSVRRGLTHLFDKSLQAANDELIKARLAGGALHTVFGRTILYCLRREGPMTTVDLHPLIQSIHPDLCDDSVDRVIDGKRFGKKWKHAVRTAQQDLKKGGLVRLRNDLWEAVSSEICPGEDQ